MAAISSIIAGAALAVGAGTAVQSYKQGQKAEEAADKADSLNRAGVNTKELAETRRTARESRIARAKVLQGSINTGQKGSSASAGQASSIGTQAGSQFAQANNSANLSNDLITQQAAQRNAVRRQREQAALSSLAFNVAGFAAGQIGNDSGGVKETTSQTAGKPQAAGQVTGRGQSPNNRPNIFQGQTSRNVNPYDVIT